MIDRLRKIATIKLDGCNDMDKRDRYLLIIKILEDDNCFKKMDIKIAYRILEDLGFRGDEVRRIYDELIF